MQEHSKDVGSVGQAENLPPPYATTPLLPTGQGQFTNADVDSEDYQRALLDSINDGPSTKRARSQELPLVAGAMGFAQPRIPGVPAGLFNIGNTCYFNALMQIMYNIAPLRERVLAYRMIPGHQPLSAMTADDRHGDGCGNRSAGSAEDDGAAANVAADSQLPSIDQMAISKGPASKGALSVPLVMELQRLFARLSMSAGRSVYPNAVMENLFDDDGRLMQVGHQQDVSEFCIKFLSRLEEAFTLNCTDKHGPNLIKECAAPHGVASRTRAHAACARTRVSIARACAPQTLLWFHHIAHSRRRGRWYAGGAGEYGRSGKPDSGCGRVREPIQIPRSLHGH